MLDLTPETIGKKFTEYYINQPAMKNPTRKTASLGPIGPSLLSSIVWDTWSESPILPYTEPFRDYLKEAFTLEVNPTLKSMPTSERYVLYCKACKVMYKILEIK